LLTIFVPEGVGTPEGIRTLGLLLRRQLLYPTELLARILEQVTRIELASPAWKAGALTIVLHLQDPPKEIVSLKIITYKGKCVKGISSGFFQVLHFFVFF
jgi:hypothetical protein